MPNTVIDFKCSKGFVREIKIQRAADTPSPILGSFAELTKFDAAGAGLGSVPRALGRLSKLSFLDLRGNNLTKIPAEIGELSQLTFLDVSENQIGSLQPKIGNLAQLTTLRISKNKLTKLPPELGNLTELVELTASDNDLTELPPFIGNLTNLSYLNLAENELVSIPGDIGKLTKLNNLYLQYNQLTTLPPEIGSLPLRQTSLDNNRFTSLPVEIGNIREAIVPSQGWNLDPWGMADSGVELPYVAIGECKSGTPALIAITKTYAPTIIVEGTTYNLSPDRSQIATATIDKSGTGPQFEVTFAGVTKTITCQDDSGSGDLGAEILEKEVVVAQSCLAGQGRIDFNIVNSESRASYRIKLDGQPTRGRTVLETQAWRTPFTGRPDGNYAVKITKTLLSDNTTVEIAKILSVDCGSETPTQLSKEIQVIPYCSAGKGFIRYQFVNPTNANRSYIIMADGLPNRSTTARPFGASISGISGLADGKYNTTVDYADQRDVPVYTGSVSISCGK